jgi:hypothetical protein
MRPALRTEASPRSDRSCLRFAVTQLAGTVTAARLRLYAETGEPDVSAVGTVAGRDWAEEEITCATAPAPGQVVAASEPVARDSWTSVDVTALVRGDGVVSLALTTDGETYRADVLLGWVPARAWQYVSAGRGAKDGWTLHTSPRPACPRAWTTTRSAAAAPWYR